jgi:hypothetical protein
VAQVSNLCGLIRRAGTPAPPSFSCFIGFAINSFPLKVLKSP